MCKSVSDGQKKRKREAEEEEKEENGRGKENTKVTLVCCMHMYGMYYENVSMYCNIYMYMYMCTLVLRYKFHIS